MQHVLELISRQRTFRRHCFMCQRHWKVRLASGLKTVDGHVPLGRTTEYYFLHCWPDILFDWLRNIQWIDNNASAGSLYISNVREVGDSRGSQSTLTIRWSCRNRRSPLGSAADLLGTFCKVACAKGAVIFLRLLTCGNTSSPLNHRSNNRGQNPRWANTIRRL